MYRSPVTSLVYKLSDTSLRLETVGAYMRQIDRLFLVLVVLALGVGTLALITAHDDYHDCYANGTGNGYVPGQRIMLYGYGEGELIQVAEQTVDIYLDINVECWH